MGLEYCFVCQTCNIIMEIGKLGNATKLMPYLREEHKYCNCATCRDYDIQNKMVKDEDGMGWSRADDEYTIRVRLFNLESPHFVHTTIELSKPTFVDPRQPTFWEKFRVWVEKGKTAVLRDLRLKFKMVHGLRSDWWEDDAAMDREIETKMKRLNHFITRIELVDEDVVDEIIDEVLSRNLISSVGEVR